MPRRKTLLTGSEARGEEDYWSKEAFEKRFVGNTLAELGLADDAEKLIGREPRTLADLWEAIKKDSSRPLSEQWGDLNELLTQRANAATEFLGLKKKRK